MCRRPQELQLLCLAPPNFWVKSKGNEKGRKEGSTLRGRGGANIPKDHPIKILDHLKRLEEWKRRDEDRGSEK